MTYFITETYLKEYTGYNANIDMSKVRFLIQLAYDIQINELFGTHFSKYLLEKHQEMLAGNYTYTSFEEKLVDLLQPALAWQVNFNSIVELSDQLNNSGVTSNSGDYYSPSTVNSQRYKMEMYKSNFESYKNRMNEFLCKYNEEFPEFKTDLNDDSLIKNNCVECNSKLEDLEDDGMFFI